MAATSSHCSCVQGLRWCCFSWTLTYVSYLCILDSNTATYAQAAIALGRVLGRHVLGLARAAACGPGYWQPALTLADLITATECAVPLKVEALLIAAALASLPRLWLGALAFADVCAAIRCEGLPCTCKACPATLPIALPPRSWHWAESLGAWR